MNIETKYHGTQQINEEAVLRFDSGIPGFPEEKNFVLLPLDEGTLLVMQSVKTPEIGFIVTDPFSFFPEYDFKLSESAIEQLALKQPEDAVVYAILTVQDPFEKTTANLQAPVVINRHNNRAKQVILNDTDYNTRHPLFGQKVKG
ncbi:flagellar assembly protein FliW [Siminovitchia fortis]|uniref:Flagellar assembly factor FliW n=1 Tax=Siminovitchia fortis TaxID=254758 RepID=A0A443IZ36_9BACI|nr:flagellar assembly protein FliW [Siminovitchia fortis]RWR13585.1 flagellar assembly protein FliW [Siminovitchia fortis]WHY81958.1 flagellar assembly protein FliW [Siminovitchia fortis]